MKRNTTLLFGVLVFALSVSLYGLSTMNKRTDAKDRLFVEEMIPHHEEAISSSVELMKVAQNQELIDLASKVIKAQEIEVKNMRSWYLEWYGKEYQPTGIYRPMMSSSKDLEVSKVEAKYVSEMITHHEHAVMMAEGLLKSTKRAELTSLAEDVIATQNSEISTLKRILQQTYGQEAKNVDHSMH
jgi:uncharacterized protein (DUF305 family)